MKKKIGVALTLEQRQNRLTIVHEIEQNNRLRKARKILKMVAITRVKTIHVETGFPVEFELSGVEPDLLVQWLNAITVIGYKPQVYTRTDSKDFDGKLGIVKSITKKADKNQWEVVITIDGEGNGEAKIIAFAATAFRKGDKVRLSKNEKGYLQATLLSDDDDEHPSTKELAF